MRINRFIAASSSLSRRKADLAVAEGRVSIDGRTATLGDIIVDGSKVLLDGKPIAMSASKSITLMLNKPDGYICSRAGQGQKTIYELLPDKYRNLNSIGRLDKNSSGLILLTNDGELANQLTHPKFNKPKVYRVTIDKNLSDADTARLLKGVELEDGLSKFDKLNKITKKTYEVTLHQGKNRQIRRTFEKLGYKVVKLHRISFGEYKLGQLQPGKLVEIVVK